MSQTPADSPNRWRAADLEAIRVALSIPALMPAIRAINDAMADLEELYPDAIPPPGGTGCDHRHPHRACGAGPGATAGAD
ncbi:MAG: hypothetical protein NTZ40_13605 [Cyanobacteria bacterium]|nr:hypothetical protein [Cyanobacteriota bacterium]